MKNKHVVDELKKRNKDSNVSLTLKLSKHSLVETCYHHGTWNGFTFTCTTYTCWRTGEVVIDYIDIEELIKLLKKKNLSELSSGDFPSASIQESTDGSVDVDDVEWMDEDKPTEEQLVDLNNNDLYWDSEISDSECEFPVGSIWFMEINVDGETFSLEN